MFQSSSTWTCLFLSESFTHSLFVFLSLSLSLPLSPLCYSLSFLSSLCFCLRECLLLSMWLHTSLHVRSFGCNRHTLPQRQTNWNTLGTLVSTPLDLMTARQLFPVYVHVWFSWRVSPVDPSLRRLWMIRLTLCDVPESQRNCRPVSTCTMNTENPSRNSPHLVRTSAHYWSFLPPTPNEPTPTIRKLEGDHTDLVPHSRLDPLNSNRRGTE